MKKGLAVIASLVMLIAVLSGSLVLADSGPSAPASDKVIVRVYYPNLKIGNKVLISFEAQLLETNYEEGYHLMEVTQDEIDLLTEAGLRVEVAEQQELPMVQSIPSYPCYRTVEETFATAQQIVSDHPNLATWIDVGDSWEKWAAIGGYDMLVLRLTNSAISGDKPKLFLTGAMHAREYATAELVTRFAEYLVDNYGTDADATWILDHHEVHLMLHTNPDGRKQAETGLSWRKNTNQNYCGATSDDRGADLNRNFSFMWNCCGGSSDDPCYPTYHGPYAASEPEIQATQGVMESIFPDQREPDDLTTPAPDDATGIYIDVHAYGKLVLWPWGSTSEPAPNATQLQTLGRKFAYWNDYSPEQAIGLYPTDGTSDEHAYGTLGVAAYCFEIGTSFFQSCSPFENTIVPDNMPSLIYAAKVVRTPYMTPAGPDAYSLSLSQDNVPAGTSVTLSGTVDDTRYNNSNGTEPAQNIAAAEYYIDVPPWVAGSTAIAMSASDNSFDSTLEAVEAAVDTTGWSDGKHILFLRGKDADDNWGAFSAIFLTISPGAENTMFVQAIDMIPNTKGRNRSATAVVTILDTNNNAVEGATVHGTWSGDYSASVSDSTNADGQVSFTSGRVKEAATFTFTVDDVVKDGYDYDPGLNQETSDTIEVP
jgi:carboxypeptidase T